MLAVALSVQKEILSADRAQFFESLALSLSKQRAPLNFVLIFIRIFAVFKDENSYFFQFLAAFSKIYIKRENSMKIEKISAKMS